MLVWLLLIGLSFYLGQLYRDRNIVHWIKGVSNHSIGIDIMFVGDAINCIRCMNILDNDDVRKLLEESINR